MAKRRFVSGPLRSLARNRIARRLLRGRTRLRQRRAKLALSLPVDLNLELTDRCNLRCRYCGRDQIVPRIRRAGDMEWSMVEKVTDQFAGIAAKVAAQASRPHSIEVSPDGLGEPLLYPRLFDALALVRAKIPAAHIHLNTNGIGMDEAMVGRILASELDAVTVSLNTWGWGRYEQLHRADLFGQVVGNACALLDAKASKALPRPRVTVQILGVKMNARMVEEFKRFWTRQGADSATVRPFIPLSHRIRELMPEEEQAAYVELLGLDDSVANIKRYPCPALWGSVMVDIEGWIYPCCYGVWCGRGHAITLGNIGELTVEEAYTRNVPTLRGLHMLGLWGGITGCDRCNFWAAMPNIHLGIGERWL